jgi:hypothetical protein
MAIQKAAQGTKIVLKVQNGVTDSGQPKYVERRYSNVKQAATDQNIYDVCDGIGSLQSHPVSAISRIDENSLLSL